MIGPLVTIVVLSVPMTKAFKSITVNYAKLLNSLSSSSSSSNGKNRKLHLYYVMPSTDEMVFDVKGKRDVTQTFAAIIDFFNIKKRSFRYSLTATI